MLIQGAGAKLAAVKNAKTMNCVIVEEEAIVH
jgi:hypothetical protein